VDRNNLRHRPFPLRWLNSSERFLQRLGTFRELRADALLEEATKQVGSTDFGVPDCDEPLRHLLDRLYATL